MVEKFHLSEKSDCFFHMDESSILIKQKTCRSPKGSKMVQKNRSGRDTSVWLRASPDKVPGEHGMNPP